jgi:hypothetical protein
VGIDVGLVALVAAYAVVLVVLVRDAERYDLPRRRSDSEKSRGRHRRGNDDTDVYTRIARIRPGDHGNRHQRRR